MGDKLNTPYPSANEYVTNIWQARWNALKEVVDRDRKRAREQLDLEFPALDNIYRVMLNLEEVRDCPNPHTPPLRIGMDVKGRPPRPPIVCLCGSTRFMDVFFAAGWQFTLAGEIVLSVGVCKYTDADGAHGAEALGPDVVRRLDELHLRKIDLADRVFFLNVDSYIGDSTCRELAYALGTGKRVAFLEPEAGEEFIRENRGRLDALIKELGVEEW